MPDGKYAVRDVFKYLECSKKTGTEKECPKQQIFEPGAKECVDIKTQNNETFCQNRTNGDWVDPWNCHKFFKCYDGVSHPFDCQTASLIYNPNNDQCNRPGVYPCIQVDPEETTSVAG